MHKSTDDLEQASADLRALTDDLRERIPTAAAITEAARRLGEPAAATRARSAFGARLSTPRTWGVVALMVPLLAHAALQVYSFDGLWSPLMLELALTSLLVVALVMRMGWARPILLSAMAFSTVLSAVHTWMFPQASAIYLAADAGMFALLVPWRRGELTPSGLALAGHVVAYSASAFALSFRMMNEDGSFSYMAPTALVACIAAAAATAGAILRARWSSVAGALAAVALAVVAYDLGGVGFNVEFPLIMQATMYCVLFGGVGAALVASALAWTTARSRLGTLGALRS